jgi:hypothetical protein
MPHLKSRHTDLYLPVQIHPHLALLHRSIHEGDVPNRAGAAGISNRPLLCVNPKSCVADRESSRHPLPGQPGSSIAALM